MNFWDYVTTPTDGSIGPKEGLLLSAGMLVAIVSLLMIITAEARTPAFVARLLRGTTSARKEVGPKEQRLRTELRVKVGTALGMWSGALTISVLLRLVGTPGLTTPWLPTLVLLVLPLLVGYVGVFRLIFYPRYLAVCRQIDGRKSYEPAAKKGSGKKARTEAPRTQRVSLVPGKALIGACLTPIVYYLVTAFVSVPQGVPPANHDHVWHQSGTLLTVLLGYVVGLVLSLGDDIRPLLPFLMVSRNGGNRSIGV